MTPSRKQLDAAEVWLIQAWRGWLESERRTGVDWRDARDTLATSVRAIRAMREAGTWKAPRCANCGGEVERTRHCYAIPTCEKCFPPPPALEVEYPFQRRAEVAEERVAELEARLEKTRGAIKRLRNFEPKQDLLNIIDGNEAAT